MNKLLILIILISASFGIIYYSSDIKDVQTEDDSIYRSCMQMSDYVKDVKSRNNEPYRILQNTYYSWYTNDVTMFCSDLQLTFKLLK